MAFGARAPGLRGLRHTRLGANEVIRRHRPLLSFASRSESLSSVLARNETGLRLDDSSDASPEHPTVGFGALRRL